MATEPHSHASTIEVGNAAGLEDSPSISTQDAAQAETTPTHSPVNAPVNAATLELDTDSSDGNDTDSALGDSLQGSTVSLRSSIYAYIEENGRTYHAHHSGKYMMPNDEEEQSRLDLQHHLFRMTMDGRLYLAPLSNSHYVLDIGTGTGIWAIEFEEHPSAVVIGTDLSPIQPEYLPPNCSFEVADAEDEWLFNQKFDFIHGRALLSCFRDNRSVVDTIFDNLNPGGYFELQDVCMPMRSDDGTLDGTALDEWQTNIIAGLKTMGRNLSDSTNWGKYMADAGFVDIVEQRYYWGSNPWVRGKKEKIQAAWTTQNLLEGIDGMSMALFTRILGWTRPRVEILLAQVRNDLKNRAIHAYAEVYVVHGRKPNEDQ